MIYLLSTSSLAFYFSKNSKLFEKVYNKKHCMFFYKTFWKSLEKKDFLQRTGQRTGP